MSSSSSESSAEAGENPPGQATEPRLEELHADKYNDPRAKVTPVGILIGFAVVVLAAIGAAGSIYARKTPLVQTTQFWGEETITAFQLAERLELLPAGNETFDRVELTTTPGLGHLRRALLDERNYQWTSVDEENAASTCPEQPTDKPRCIQLRFTDPTAHRFETIKIDIDLAQGWLGPSDGSRRVKLTSWVQPKLENWFATVINFEQKRYDHRD